MSILQILVAAFVLFMPEEHATGGDNPARRVVYLSNRAGLSRTFDIILRDSSGAETNVTASHPGLGITSLSAPKLLAHQNALVCFASRGKTLVKIPIGKGSIVTLAKLMQPSGQLTVGPDERTVLYADRVEGKSQLFEADLERCTTRNLSSNQWNNTEASYSSDGSRIVYVTDQDSSRSIAIMNRDGSGQRILTNNFGDDRFPHFSPDGKTIVFSSSRSGIHDMQWDLYTIDTSGENFELLYTNGAYNTSPTFSSDAREIMFVSSNLTKKSSYILLLDRTSGVVTNPTSALEFLSQNGSFSDDGRFILFEYNTIRNCEIMLYDRQSKSMNNISRNPAWDCSPSF